MRIYVITNCVRTIHSSYNQIDYELYVDKTNHPYKHYLDLLEKVKDIDDDILILEDDLVLCKDFLEHIKPIINQYKNMLINFFWQPLRNIKKTTIETKGFCYTQCIYYPKGMINKFYGDLLEPTFSGTKNIAQALEKNNIPFVNVRPHYLQHIGDKSLIWKTRPIVRSSQFIDDLEN